METVCSKRNMLLKIHKSAFQCVVIIITNTVIIVYIVIITVFFNIIITITTTITIVVVIKDSASSSLQRHYKVGVSNSASTSKLQGGTHKMW